MFILCLHLCQHDSNTHSDESSQILCHQQVTALENLHNWTNDEMLRSKYEQW